MKFSTLIKNYRQRNSLSQEELAQLLAVLELSHRALDAGTISRWERGVNAPTLKNQIRIIRKLSMNVTSKSLHQRSVTIPEEGIEKLKTRFNRSPRLVDKFYDNAKPKMFCIIHDNIRSFTDDRRLMDFTFDAYGINVNQEGALHKLIYIAGDDGEGTSVVLKFYNKAEEIVGHLVLVINKTRKIIDFLKCLKGTVSAHEIKKQLNGYTLFSVSGYASNFCVYLYICHYIMDVLNKDLGIDWYIGNTFINEDWHVLKELGADVVSKGNIVHGGGVKIGGRRYSSLTCCIDVCSLLASSLIYIDTHHIAKYGYVFSRSNTEKDAVNLQTSAING
ncbi:MAG: multiprotein-bridging factor 1 family protein [Bacteroidales bacterium]